MLPFMVHFAGKSCCAGDHLSQNVLKPAISKLRKNTCCWGHPSDTSKGRLSFFGEPPQSGCSRRRARFGLGLLVDSMKALALWRGVSSLLQSENSNLLLGATNLKKTSISVENPCGQSEDAEKT